MKPENTGKIQEDSKNMRFQKGKSGNPKGKPKGARNRSTLAAEQFLEASLEGVCKTIEKEALQGNMLAAKMILDRFLPVRKDRLLKIDLPEINTSEDILQAMRVIASAVGCGEISPSEGESLSKTLDIYAKAFETYQLESRLLQLESRL
jgi:hypothetical protein